MSEQWHIEDKSETFGPYALADLFAMMDRQEISANSWLICDGMRVNPATLRARWADPRTNAAGAVPRSSDATVASDPPPAHGAATSSEAFGPTVGGAAPPLESGLQAAPVGSTAPVVRDSVVILGRRRAGKTIYLATLYSMLWKSVGGLTMKALSGANHTSLMSIMDQLHKGVWPGVTLGVRQIEFEIDDSGRKRLLVAFDYGGEDFSRAFVAEDQASPNVRALLKGLDSAAAVILLIDPTVAVHGNVSQIADDDFGMVQAVERVRNWPGGDQVPIVLALTKIDRTKQLVREAGDVNAFVTRHYPALVRTLKKLNVIPVSAVQQKRGADGKPVPAPESMPINVDKPLRFCLEQLKQIEREKDQRERETAREMARQVQLEQSEAAVRATNRTAVYAVTAIWIVGICVFALIWILKES